MQAIERKVTITLTEEKNGEILLFVDSNFTVDVDSVENLEQTVFAMLGQAAAMNDCSVAKRKIKKD